MNECIGKIFLLNSQPVDVKNFDFSFLEGPDYIYEVFRVINGVALFIEDHLKRLNESCLLAGHFTLFNLVDIERDVFRLIEANEMKTGNIKMVLRKPSVEESDFLIYITEHQYPSDSDYLQGVDLALYKGVRHNPNAKVMDVDLRKANNKLKEKAGVYETLLVDEDGNITEGSRSNVFFIRNDKVITPPLEDVLPGITRKHVMEICKELSLQIVEKKVLARSLVVMEGIFISGTSRKVLPVKKVDDLDFDPAHPITQKIMDAFEAKIKNYIGQHQIQK